MAVPAETPPTTTTPTVPQPVSCATPRRLRRSVILAAVMMLACAGGLSAWLYHQAAGVSSRPTEPVRGISRPRLVPRRQTTPVLPAPPTAPQSTVVVSGAEAANPPTELPTATAPPVPAPNLAPSDVPPPAQAAVAAEATAPSTSAPTEPMATSLPATQPDPTTESGTAPVASEPPTAAPGMPPPQEPPAAAPAAVPPRLDFPAATDLPPRETAAATTPAPYQLGAVAVSEGTTLALTLLGGLTAGPPGTSFELTPCLDPAMPRWQFLCRRTTPDDAAPVTVAELTHVHERLEFTWLVGATQVESVFHLGNCVLRISCGTQTHDLRLRRPERCEPLQVNLKKPTATLRAKITAPPDDARLRFQVLSVSAPWPPLSTLNPAEPVAVGTGTVRVALGDEAEPDILSLTLTPQCRAVFQLTGEATFRLQPNGEFTPCTAKRLQEAEQWVNQNQTTASSLAQQIRALVATLPPSDPAYAVRQAELRQVEAQLAECTKMTQRMQWLNQTREQVGQGAPIHFRVFYMADDCEVDLLRSDAAAAP